MFPEFIVVDTSHGWTYTADRQGEFFTEQTADMFAQDVNRTLKVPSVRVFRVVPHRFGTELPASNFTAADTIIDAWIDGRN